MSILTGLRTVFRPGPDTGPTGDLSDVPQAVEAMGDSSVRRASVSEEVIAASSIDDILRVEEVSDARFFIGGLFKRRFHGEAPDYPKHYVAFYREAITRYVPLGYVHYTAFEDSYLCGGLVIDDRLYRRVPSPHRKLIRHAGGIAEKMLRDSFARLSEAPAIWGYVGDKQSEEVNRRVGFRHTRYEHIMVVWNVDLSEAEQESRLARVAAIGPF